MIKSMRECPYKRLENGLLDIPECGYVTETHVDERKQICQSIMYRYRDEYERKYVRSQVALILHLHRICYFKDNGELIYKEVYDG